MARERVKGHYRRTAKGTLQKVRPFKRKKRKKAKKRAVRSFTKKCEITYYQDANGQLLAKRKFRCLKR